MTTANITPEIDQELISLVPEEIESTALVLQGAVNLVKIEDSAMYVRVAGVGTDAATNIKRLKAILEPICQQRFQHHKRATQVLADKTRPFEEVKRKASQLLGAYDQEQERLRREKEAQLQREAEAEARRVAEEQRKLAEAEARRISDEQALADAVELEAAGDTKGADAVLNNPVPVPVYIPPVYVPPVIVQKETPQVAGKSTVTTWSFRVKKSPDCYATEPHTPEECSVCLAEVAREYLILDTKTVGQLVRTLKEKFNVPGIQAYPNTGARFKG